MVSNICSYIILADTRYKTPAYRVFWIGQWDGHIMDWRGCNFRIIEDDKKKIFRTIKEAKHYADKKYKYKMHVDGEGQHFAEVDNYIEARTVYDDGDALPSELSQEEWDELRERVKEARNERTRYTY